MQKQENSYYLKGILASDNRVILDIYKEFLPMVKNFVLRENGGEADAEEAADLHRWPQRRARARV